jgi:hypothetical protein
MTVQASANNSSVPFIRSGPSFVRDSETLLQDAGRTTVLENLTLLARNAVTVPVTGTADAGNTGDGTVTGVALSPGTIPRIGIWELECTAIGTDAASGTAAFTGTGNGTASAVTVGSLTIVGDYILTCVDATVSGSEIFQPVDPNGVVLENLTVGVAYLNDHFGLTLTDGATDFIVGDVWTLTMIAEHGGTFKLIDPGSNIIAADLVMNPGAGTATTFTVADAGLTLVITDGATDFAVTDLFTITITANGKWVPFDEDSIDGAQIPRGILLTGPVTAAALVAGDVVDQAILAGGTCTIDVDQLVIEGTATVNTVLSGGQTISDMLAAIGIFLEDTVDITEFENA